MTHASLAQSTAELYERSQRLYGLNPERVAHLYRPRRRAEGMVCGPERIPARRLAMDTLWRASGQVHTAAAEGDANALRVYHALNRAIYVLDGMRAMGVDCHTEVYAWAGSTANNTETAIERFGVDEPTLHADAESADTPDRCWRDAGATQAHGSNRPTRRSPGFRDVSANGRPSMTRGNS